jgi:MFS family permease
MASPTQTGTSKSPEQEQSGAGGIRQVLKNRNFLLLWLAQLISLTILNAANYGLIVLVNDMTHSVFMAGLAIISFTLPAVPFSAIAGVIVDRLHKRWVLWLSNVLRMGTMLLMFLALLLDRTSLWPLFALTFLTSFIGQFFIPAEGSSIPLLVGERELMAGLSLFNVSLSLSQALGFLLLGRLVVSIFSPFTIHLGAAAFNVQPIDMLFAIAAVLYVVCALLILCIPSHAFDEAHVQRYTLKDTHIDIGPMLHNLWQDLLAGWQIVRRDSLLLFSVVQLSVIGILMLLIGELAGSFVQQVLHRPAEDMSLILAPAGIGLIGASILMPRITERVGKVRLTVIGFIVLAAGFLLLPVTQLVAYLISPQHSATSPLLLWTTIALVLVLGIAMACVNIPTNTIMQEHAPEEGRARVLSLQFMLYNAGSIPVLLFAGVLAQYVGFNLLIILIAIGMLLLCWWGSRYIYTDKQPAGNTATLP